MAEKTEIQNSGKTMNGGKNTRRDWRGKKKYRRRKKPQIAGEKNPQMAETANGRKNRGLREN
jgi:hypothetical protein